MMLYVNQFSRFRYSTPSQCDSLRFKIFKSKFYTIWKTSYHHFGSFLGPRPTRYRSDRWPNVLSHILIAPQSLLPPNLTRLSSNEHIWSIWGNRGPYNEKKWVENMILVNITIFCGWNMPTWVSLHEETKFRDDRYNSSVCIVSFSDWPASLSFSWTRCRMVFRPFSTLNLI